MADDPDRLPPYHLTPIWRLRHFGEKNACP